MAKGVSSRPTIIDVAKAAGVSVATASNALTGRRVVDPTTRTKVASAATSLGYTPHLGAQRLRTGRADTIAIFSPMPFAIAGGPARFSFLMEIAASAASAALQSGIALVLVPPLESGELPLRNMHIDGALVVEPAEDDAEVALLRQRGVAVVSIGRHPGDVTIPYVDIRSGDVAELMLGHLHTPGTRRIALVVGSQRRNSYMEMEQAYLGFVAGKGMAPTVVHLDERDGEVIAYEFARRFLRDNPDIDAICAPVDVFAVGISRAAAELGRRIPEDLRILTRHDGLRARGCSPPLTAFNLHLDQLAILGVELLLEHVKGDTGRHSVLGPVPELVIRGSSAVP